MLFVSMNHLNIDRVVWECIVGNVNLKKNLLERCRHLFTCTKFVLNNKQGMVL